MRHGRLTGAYLLEEAGDMLAWDVQGWSAIWAWYSVDTGLGLEIQDLLASLWWEGLGEEVVCATSKLVVASLISSFALATYAYLFQIYI